MLLKTAATVELSQMPSLPFSHATTYLCDDGLILLGRQPRADLDAGVLGLFVNIRPVGPQPILHDSISVKCERT